MNNNSAVFENLSSVEAAVLAAGDLPTPKPFRRADVQELVRQRLEERKRSQQLLLATAAAITVILMGTAYSLRNDLGRRHGSVAGVGSGNSPINTADSSAAAKNKSPGRGQLGGSQRSGGLDEKDMNDPSWRLVDDKIEQRDQMMKQLILAIGDMTP